MFLNTFHYFQKKVSGLTYRNNTYWIVLGLSRIKELKVLLGVERRKKIHV